MTTSSTIEAQVAGFIGNYEPDMQVRLREARTTLRAMFPQGFELVFDNYNALVFGFSPTDRTTGSFLSIAAYPRWITLFFLHGSDLDDPEGLLEGDGKRVRGIRLKTPADLDAPAVRALIAQAVAPHAAAFAVAPPLTTIVRMVADKQRPRRPAAKD